MSTRRTSWRVKHTFEKEGSLQFANMLVGQNTPKRGMNPWVEFPFTFNLSFISELLKETQRKIFFPTLFLAYGICASLAFLGIKITDQVHFRHQQEERGQRSQLVIYKKMV